MIVTAARVIAPEGDFTPGHVVIENGRIKTVAAGIPSRADRTFREGTIVPGFIDLQVNGGEGVDLLSCDSDALARLTLHLASTGTTGFLPTLVSAPADQIHRTIDILRQTRAEGAEILGLHLEGPALSPQRKGAHHPRWLRAPKDAEVRRMYADTLPDLRLVTLAPELPGAEELMDWLARERVLIALGHTDATYEQATLALAHGARMITHLFNGMRPFHHRDPGVIGAAFDNSQSVCTLISDGVHVHPAAVRLAFRALGAGRIALVTDATAATGMAPGTYPLGSRYFRLEAGDAPRLEDGTLAGSALRMDQAIRNLSGWSVELRDAVLAASHVPAAVLGLTDRGVLAAGLRADLCVLGRDGYCVLTLVGGRIVYERQ